jgi:hypothetical protein
LFYPSIFDGIPFPIVGFYGRLLPASNILILIELNIQTIADRGKSAGNRGKLRRPDILGRGAHPVRSNLNLTLSADETLGANSAADPPDIGRQTIEIHAESLAFGTYTTTVKSTPNELILRTLGGRFLYDSRSTAPTDGTTTLGEYRCFFLISGCSGGPTVRLLRMADHYGVASFGRTDTSGPFDNIKRINRKILCVSDRRKCPGRQQQHNDGRKRQFP